MQLRLHNGPGARGLDLDGGAAAQSGPAGGLKQASVPPQLAAVFGWSNM